MQVLGRRVGALRFRSALGIQPGTRLKFSALTPTKSEGKAPIPVQNEVVPKSALGAPTETSPSWSKSPVAIHAVCIGGRRIPKKCCANDGKEKKI